MSEKKEPNLYAVDFVGTALVYARSEGAARNRAHEEMHEYLRSTVEALKPQEDGLTYSFGEDAQPLVADDVNHDDYCEGESPSLAAWCERVKASR